VARLLAASRVCSSSMRPTKVGLAKRPPISPGLSRVTGRRGTTAVKRQCPKVGNRRGQAYARCPIRGDRPSANLSWPATPILYRTAGAGSERRGDTCKTNTWG
jgi:hypothetical protein